jgi:peptide/nickel transport system permease protein
LIPILLSISVVVFVLVEIAPGDPVDALIPPGTLGVSENVRANLRDEMGLDEPAPVRYVYWLRRAATGDFGYSLASQRPISRVIRNRLPATLSLVGFALLVSIVLGIVTGVISAVKQYSWIDYLVTLFSFAWLSVPVFFLGLMVIYVFAVRLGWFPAFGISDPGVSGFDAVLDRLHHLILPGLTLALELTAALTRYVRSSLLEVLESDYMRTARAKGLAERVVILRHGLGNALIPMITVIALRLPILFGGAVVVETVFQWPGLGTLTLSAANQRDYPLVMALALFMATIVVLSNFLADIAYAVADPRIRYD